MSCSFWQKLLRFAGILACLGSGMVAAQVSDRDLIATALEEQQRAKALTTELLEGVLDVQLRQLDENGLLDHELYRDIALMRRQLHRLVDTEMSKVVDLLSDAQRLPPSERTAAFVTAREQIRLIVRRLSVERQQLLKRLKVVELAEQVRRLVRQQQQLAAATSDFLHEPQKQTESLTLKLIEDQRDMKELFLQLSETLSEMRTRTGLHALVASDGLRILKVADIGSHLDDAVRDLQAIQFVPASHAQLLVVKGFKDLLKVIERALAHSIPKV